MPDNLRDLERRLRVAASVSETSARDAVQESADRVRESWRRRMMARRHTPTHIPHLPDQITYDVTKGPLGPEAEIGPDKLLSQGPVGNLLEFGSINNAPHNDGGAALREEAPKFFLSLTRRESGLL